MQILLVTLDVIYNRVIRNWKHRKTTWIFCDEFYLLFRYPYSADFFYKLWKWIRKYNGLLIGLTRNVEELLLSDTARMMLANSELLVFLNQAATDREERALLHDIFWDTMEIAHKVEVRKEKIENGSGQETQKESPVYRDLA